MKVLRVENSATEHEFLQLPFAIYKNDRYWIAPLKQDVQKVFDPRKNKYFNHGECARWILQDNNGKTIGRIAAFINYETAYTEEQPTGGCGFFECTNNREAAFVLFDTAKHWLQERGMEAMDGPINFGERNAWWGLLVEGFTPPTYQMNYNPPYYRTLFEAYGFKDYFQQYSYSININAPRPERYVGIVERLLSNGEYSFRHLEKGKLKQYAADFRSIFNRTWKFLPNFKEMSEEQAWSVIKSMKPVMIDYLCWFGYYKQEPVALFIMLPELNGWFKHVHGNLNLWGMLKFLWLKFFDRQNRKVFGIIFGVVPEHQRKGLEAAIVMAADKVVRSKNRWDEIELVWVGDFNTRMMRTCEVLGGKIVKTHITYRKLFDATKEFKRHKVIE
ncbi:MAG: GNAT family N-acetyltransferase [Chitinophagales bacterium]|nr:GNAT family N-acetyltransferase [Chitinophagales bacterium]